ncbi:MAG TPA: ABC transporter ATP-binding protein [Actinomycetales bacterium]|nr:ABC transporter ATP-binding protein [Actinomycetales bacterium]
MSGGADLRLSSVTKRFGDFVAVDDLDLTIPAGSFFALLGPSGCGKTTTLRMVAGLEEPTQGRIHLGDRDVTTTKPHQREVNTVFQTYALFPHMDVFENVAFGLRRRKVKDVTAKVDEALNLVELGHLARRRPAQLSGGQQQRIALARAVVNRPSVLLLDEPLGALDLKLRRQMQVELKRIQTEVGLTFVHVTHDQEEAMTMADTIAVMNAGRIEQLGSPLDLYESPHTTFVANFLGQSNLLEGSVQGRSGDDVLVHVHGRRLVVPGHRNRSTTAGLLVGVRPEKVGLVPQGRAVPEGQNLLDGGVVVDASFCGVSTQYLVRMPWGQQLSVFTQNLAVGGVLPVGTAVSLAWEPAHTFALAGDAAAGAEVEDALAGVG